MRERLEVVLSRVHWPQTIWLTIVWMFLWGQISLANALGGFLVSVAVLALFPLPPLGVPMRLHPVPALILTVRFFADMTMASVQVAWLALRPGPSPRSLVVDLQLRGRNELFMTITAEMVALVPGSVVIDLEPETGTLTLHVINVSSRAGAEQIRRRVLAQEARVLRALAADPEAVLDPRRRREAERRTAETGGAG